MKYLGTSSYIALSQARDVIGYCRQKGLRSVRYSSRPNSSREFDGSVVSALLSAGLRVIIEPNHYYLTTNGSFDIDKISRFYVSNWGPIKENFEALVILYANNPLVAFEGINEYSFSDIYDRHEELLDIVREYGNNDYIATIWEQPFRKIEDPNTWQGFHRYANYGTLNGYKQRIINMINAGIPANRICNTEVGAHTREAASFTLSLVQELNGFLEYNLDVGNMVWMFEGIKNASAYDRFALVYPVDAQGTTSDPEPGPDPEPEKDLNAIAIAAIAAALLALKD